jgi:hypothetical protein
MQKPSMARRVGMTAALTFACLAPAGAAMAQTASYPGNPPQGEVLGTGDERGDTAVAGVVASRTEAPAAVSGARGGLAVTGTDVAQLAGLGVVLVGGGVVLVRRSRRPLAATA